jgi:hypothetical protein
MTLHNPVSLTASALAAALFATFAHAADVRPNQPVGPDWSARIGSGHVQSSNSFTQSVRGQTLSSALSSASGAHWSSRIGTGQVDERDSSTQPVRRNDTQLSAIPQAHWSAQIGTGRGAQPAAGAGS